jgi:hypothetical protein
MDLAKQPTFEAGYRRFWNKQLSKGQARTWEGRHRKAYTSSFSPNQLNAKMSFAHCGLINSDSRLAANGVELLQIGKVYSADSDAFLDALGTLILEDGRHLELIFWVDEVQREMSSRAKSIASKYYDGLDKMLQKRGVIKRLTRRGGKQTFLRDEQKLWNKLGLLKPFTAKQYFHPKEGLRFNWRRISSLIGT